MGEFIKVSVIIPVYNSEQYIGQTLDTVINQTLRQIEVICIDDGSRDGSLDILNDYAKRDSRVIVISQENSGAAVARNRGLSLARGEYLSFLDADDFFEPDMLEKAYTLAKACEAQICVFGCDNYYAETDTFTPCTWSIRSSLIPQREPFAGVDIPKDTFKAFVGWAWDKLFSREFIHCWYLLFQDQRTTNDMLFVFSAIVRAERIVTTHQVLAHHRREVGSLSVTREKSWHCFHDALIALRTQLIEWDLYDQLEQDFINYCLHFSLWNLNTLAEPTHSLLQKKLKEEWFEEFGISEHDANYFFNNEEYNLYRKLFSH